MTRRHPVIERDLAAIAALPLPWGDLHGKGVMITGASGFLGSYLVEFLAYLNEVKRDLPPITILALARNKEKLAARLGHLLDKPFLKPVIHDVATPLTEGMPVDFIVHAASLASPRNYLSAPMDTIRANVLGTMALLEVTRENHAKLLLMSSGAVYGQSTGKDEISETDFGPLDPLDPRSCYAESKRMAETTCLAYWREFKTSALIARVSHTYGPGIDLHDGRIFSDAIVSVLRGEDIQLHGDGLESRPFCYVSDMTAGLLLLLLRGQAGEAYNVGATEELTMHTLAKLIIRLSGHPGLKVRCNTNPGVHGQAARSSGHFDTTKIRALGWSCDVPPEQGFGRTLEYFGTPWNHNPIPE